MRLDLDTLTLGEVAFIERYADVPLSSFGDDDVPKGRMMIAIVTVTKRRDGNPQYSPAEAEKLTLAEANKIVGAGEDETTAALADLPSSALVTDAVPAAPVPDPDAFKS
ncbi:hypothetical protein HUN59_04630 [Curtobacterium sp. Csp2]|uniref:hypothetical protein n=1 Tax=Curtobacterium sp. Csp2 TaxID=2495430 RepID=UPI0015808443|nr:hypothetical protein [Curtobacterium sp. Csp2]QKS15597.1 hypothetical protein HUN59_04630 [Curtobacterium sp. Csp2]